MTDAQSKELQVGNTVTTDSLPEGEHHEGTVIEANWHAVKIEWDDGQVGLVDHRGMEKINGQDQ